MSSRADNNESWHRAAQAMAELDRMDEPTRKRKREQDEEAERELARKRRATALAVSAAREREKAAAVAPEERERRARQAELDRKRAAEDAAWRELNERAKRAEVPAYALLSLPPPPPPSELALGAAGAGAGAAAAAAVAAASAAGGAVAEAGLDAWQEAVEPAGRSTQVTATTDGWAKWVPKGVQFKNRGERRAAALAAKEAAERGETATAVGSKVILYAAGKAWEDPTLKEWPENDFRLFVGDLGPDVTTPVLAATFGRYASFAKAKVVRDKGGKHRGFGFVSFLDPDDYETAFKELNGKFIGNNDRSRPCKLRKSTWRDRLITSNKSQRKIAKLALRDEVVAQQKELGASTAQSIV